MYGLILGVCLSNTLGRDPKPWCPCMTEVPDKEYFEVCRVQHADSQGTQIPGNPQKHAAE